MDPEGQPAKDFYDSFHSPEISNQERWELECAFRGNPENLIPCFKFISSTGLPTNQIKFIALTIKAIFNQFYDQLSENRDVIEGFKQLTIQALSSSSDYDVVDKIIYSVSKLIEQEVGSWPEYFALITERVEANNPLSYNIAMNLISNCVSHMAFDEFEQNYELFLNIYERQMEIAQPQNIANAFNMIRACISVPGCNFEVFIPVIQQMVEFFVSALPKYNTIFKDISSSLGSIFRIDNLTSSPVSIYEALSQIFSNESITPLDYPYVLTPICNLIKKYGDDFVDQMPSLLQQIFNYSVHSIQGGQQSFLQSPALNITYNIRLLDTVPDYEMFNETKAIIDEAGTESEDIFIGACAMYYDLIEIMQSDIHMYNPTIINSMIEYLGVESSRVQEAAMYVLCEAAKNLESNQIDLADLIVGSITPFVSTEANDYVLTTLDTIQEVFDNAPISTSLLTPFAQQLISYVQEDDSNMDKIISLLSSLVTTTKGDATQFITDFFEPANSILTTESEDLNVLRCKGYVLEFFANIIVNPHNGVDDETVSTLHQAILEQSFNLIDIDDSNLRLSIVMVLQKLIKAKSPLLLECKEKINEFLTVIFENMDFAGLDGDSGDIKFQSENMNLITNVFIMVKAMFKYYNELLPENLNKIFNYGIIFSTLPFDDIADTALSACLYMVIYILSHEIDPTPFWEHFNSLLSMEDPKSPAVIATMYQIYSKLILKGIELPEVILSTAIEAANAIIDGSHPVQKEEELEDDEMWNNECYKLFFKFYDAIFEKGLPFVSIAEFVEKFEPFQSREGDNKGAIVYYINSLLTIYLKCDHQTVGSIVLGTIVNIICSHVELCDFTIPPIPIQGLTQILKNKSSAVPLESSLFDQLSDLLSNEYSGELYYWETIMSSIAFICNIIKLNVSGFDPTSFVELILQRLPVKVDVSSADDIYSALLGILTPENGEYYTSFVRSIALTLGYHDVIFNQMKLSQTTLQAMKNAVISYPDAEAFLSEVFADDQVSGERCIARLQ